MIAASNQKTTGYWNSIVGFIRKIYIFDFPTPSCARYDKVVKFPVYPAITYAPFLT